MASRVNTKTIIRNYLGTAADDPLYGDTTAGVSPLLDPVVQQVVDGLIGEIHETNRHYLSKTVTLQPDSSTASTYALATQAAPVLDFAHWLEVRYDNNEGARLSECRIEELLEAGSGYFALYGPDESVIFELSSSDQGGRPLFLRYGYWPADLTDDNSIIPGIPLRYHDVVALESLFVFGVGGESRWPEELRERWKNRRAALFSHITRRGVEPKRTRLSATPYL